MEEEEEEEEGCESSHVLACCSVRHDAAELTPCICATSTPFPFKNDSKSPTVAPAPILHTSHTLHVTGPSRLCDV